MRLIDADKLILHLNDFMLQQSPIDVQDIESIKVSAVIKDCIKAVDEQPTAYNVDKVLEQLEYKVKEYDERIEKRKGPTFFDETERIKQFDERAWGIEIAIEIVKGGGIDGNTNT